MKAIESRRAEVKRLFEDGIKPVDIAKTLTLPVITVHNDLRALGFRTSKPRAPKPEASRESLAVLREVLMELSLPNEAASYRSHDLEVRAAIIRGLIEHGVAADEISRVLGVSYDRLIKLAKKMEIVIPRASGKAASGRVPSPRTAMVAERRADVTRLIVEGKSMTEVATALGCKVGLVSADMRVLGLKMQKTNSVNDEEVVRQVTEMASAGKIAKEISDLTGISYYTVGAVAKKHGITLPRMTPTHGLVSTYRGGCKCEPCVTVGKAYDLKCKQVRVATKVKPEHIHGTIGGATNWGCDCKRCLDAVRGKYKESMKLPEAPTQKFQRWTEEEDAVIADRSMTAREIAIKLGRSVGAVNLRRANFRREQSIQPA